MKEFHKQISNIKENSLPIKYPKPFRLLKNENININFILPNKKDLPELKLIKNRPESEQEIKMRRKVKINKGTKLRYVPFIMNKNKNFISLKKAELFFPTIKNGENKTLTNFFGNKFNANNEIKNSVNNDFIKTNIDIQQLSNKNKFLTKRKTMENKRNQNFKTLYGTYGKYFKNTNNNIDINLMKNKNYDIEEKNNLDNHNHHNELFSIELNIKNSKNLKNNKSFSQNNQKIKKFPNESIGSNNMKKNNHTTTNLKLINIPDNDNMYLKQKNNSMDNNFINNINIPNYLNKKSNFLDSFKPTPLSLPTTNSFKEYDIFSKFNVLNNFISPFSIFPGLNSNRKTELTPEIFKTNYKNFQRSIKSIPDEFTLEDKIKGYAYNSSTGKYRDYNEDTITVTKINLDNVGTFFFGLYDGHGGNGCSLYLKENLHLLIKKFSNESLIEAINEVENNFLKFKAVDEKGLIKDHSGSCGIIALIQKNKLIIANIGDSRIVIFKKNSLFFNTTDHKPNSPNEKIRIENSGGKIYQTDYGIPIYQNGKKIEMPWRVLPGRLSISRAFGDIEAKNEDFGGKKNVVIAKPDMYEFDLDEDFNFMVIGCDGIFDVLSNEQILECAKIVIQEKKINDKNINFWNISELCGDIADMIIKSSLALDSFDNISCIVIAFNLKELIL